MQQNSEVCGTRSMEPENLTAETLFYGDWLAQLQQAVQVVLARIEAVGGQITANQGRSPIEHCKWRIKSAASMQEKLRRNGWPVTLAAVKAHIYDGVGVRVVCPFINDIYLLAQALRQQEQFQVCRERDYVLHPKANGYRSYHLIAQVPLAGEQTSPVPVEIQLRTIAMDCWASLEHQLRYKKNLPESAVLAAELKRCADEMASTDLSLQAIQEVLDLHNGACLPDYTERGAAGNAYSGG